MKCYHKVNFYQWFHFSLLSYYIWCAKKKFMLTNKVLCSSLMILITFSSFAQVGSNSGASIASVNQFNTMLNLGFLSKSPTKFRVDGSPYLFEKWDQRATIVTKKGESFKMKDVNFNGMKNRIIAKLPGDSLYTFNSFLIKRAVINNRVFENIVPKSGEGAKVYEIIARSPEFVILKDHTVEISEGSSNPMRGTIYSRYITREGYFIFDGESVEKFKPKKKKVLALLGSKKESVANYVEEKDLSYRNDSDLNKIIEYYSGL